MKRREHRSGGSPKWGALHSGPFNRELLVEWFNTGHVTEDALVCAVGTQTWRPLSALLADTATSGVRRTRFDPSKERCMVELEPLPPEPADELPTEPHSERPSAPPSSGTFLDLIDEVTRVEVPRPFVLTRPRLRS